VKKLDPSADELPNIPQMDLVDDNSYLGGTHEQLTSKKKEKDDVFLMSMWDIEKKFKLDSCLDVQSRSVYKVIYFMSFCCLVLVVVVMSAVQFTSV
jgi:hypothetical protein